MSPHTPGFIRMYGIVILPPGNKESLYTLFSSLTAAELYLISCQQATDAKHWRIVEVDVPRDYLNDKEIRVQ